MVYFAVVFGDILKTLFAKIDGLEGTFWADRAFSVLLLAIALLYYILKKVIQELKVLPRSLTTALSPDRS